MQTQFLKFNDVSFGYENSINNLISNATFQISKGWTGIIGVNGSGKTTILKLACGLLEDFTGTIESPYNVYYNEQRTDNFPENFENMLTSYDKLSFKLIDMLDIEYNWVHNWRNLSHGERKKVQIACALWSQSNLLAVDEPTNHLDYETKVGIIETLKSYNGIGIIVSHDRNLLEILCSQFLFIEPPHVKFHRGKLSEILLQRELENKFSLKQLELKKLEIQKLAKEYERRNIVVEKSKKKSSKRYVGKKDHDSKAKIDLTRLTGKESSAARLKKQMYERLNKVQTEIENINVTREYETGIYISNSVSKRNYLLNMKSNIIKLSDSKNFTYKDLTVNSTDKIGLGGKNGSGKSTIIKEIMKNINADKENITYIPQEITVEETKEIVKEIRELSNNDLGKLMIIISKLGSDAKRLLNTEIPSPGETRKLLLGLGITKSPHIIIMDEPTNHMDLVSIECLEKALAEVKCALLLVSHDKKFLKTLTNIEWKIIEKDNEYFLI